MELGIDQEHYNKYIDHPDFKRSIQKLESENNRFKNIPLQQKQLAFYLLLNNKLDLVKNLGNLLYKRPVPTIEEFLTEEYLPGHPITEPGNIWRKELFDIYSPKSSIFEHILTGAIGTAKSSTAIISQFYNLFRITSLRAPQLVMNSAPTKPLSLLLFGITLTKSSRTLMDGFRSLLKDCKYFYQVKKITEFDQVPDDAGIVPYVDKGDTIEFPNFVRIISGSQVQHSIGEDLFGVIFDEAEYHGSGNSEKTTNLYLEVFKRVRSRFLGKKFIMINLVSSIKDQHGVIASHIVSGGAGKDFTKVSSMSIWEVAISTGKLPKSILDDTFYVMRGTKTHPSKILDDLDSKRFEDGLFQVPTGSEVITIPSIYRADFKLNVEQSLRDIAGSATYGDEMPFDDISGIETPYLMPIITLEAPLMSDEPLLKKFPEEFIIETPAGLKWRRLPGVKRYFHCFTGDTKILLADGNKKTFKELVESNIRNIDVISYSNNKNGYVSNTTIDIFKTGKKKILELEFDDGYKVKCTPDHRFLTKNKGWVEAKDLTEEDELESISKNRVGAFKRWSVKGYREKLKNIISNSMKGKVHKEETKSKISKSMIGNTNNKNIAD